MNAIDSGRNWVELKMAERTEAPLTQYRLAARAIYYRQTSMGLLSPGNLGAERSPPEFTIYPPRHLRQLSLSIFYLFFLTVRANRSTLALPPLLSRLSVRGRVPSATPRP